MNILETTSASPGQARDCAKLCHFWCHNLTAVLGGIMLSIGQAAAQSYSLDWWDADAGGTSSGGVYIVTGTIGQPEAGNLGGGSFTLSGGFWGASQVRLPNMPPAITITWTSTNTIVLTWPSPATGFLLQQAADLKNSNWIDAALKPSNDGTTLSVVLPPNPGLRFYRLKK